MTGILKYSEFFWTFTWRNVKLQYTNFWLGLFWGILQPLLISSIFYIALNNRLGVDFSHYFLYIYTGLILWNIFSGGLGSAYICFLQNSSLVKNIYFPRYLLPLTFLAAKLVDLLIALCILILLVMFSDLEIKSINKFLIFSILGILQLLFVAGGCYLLFSVITVRYRGFQVIYPFVNQVIFFTSSAVYDISISIENKWLSMLFQVNPINLPLATFRMALFQGDISVLSVFFYSACSMIIGLMGYFFFNIENKQLLDRL